MAWKVKTEIYSRVSGYYRPVNQWNLGKQEEFKDRNKIVYKEEKYVEQTRV